MEKQFKKDEYKNFLTPKMLFDLHKNISKLALHNKKDDISQLSEDQVNRIRKLLDKTCLNYEKENTMKLSADKSLRDPAIGIDLGTTYCCVAVFYGNEIRIIRSVSGSNTTPSYVEYTEEGGHVVGETAKELAFKNPENTIFDAKRIIGRRMDDEKLQDDMSHWPFSVVDEGGIPKLKIYGKTYRPEEVSARLLKALKAEAEQFINCKIKKAVITVPAYFSDGQRKSTIDAGELAGFQVLDILNEPTAAAIAYKLERIDEEARNILVYDLGGGTFDIAILEINEGNIRVLGVDGDTHLGGEDFDRNLMNYCAQEFKQDSGIDLFSGRKSRLKKTQDEFRSNIRRLQLQCEKAKISLSTASKVTVSVNQMCNNDLEVEVTREKYEELNQTLFEKTIEVVDKTLTKVKLKKEEINDIVLIGGSTRIPKIQQLLETYFNGKALNHTINPDEAVAYGAAVHAAMENGLEAKKHFNLDRIQDVTPMAYGVDVADGRFSQIIPRFSEVPSKEFHKRFMTNHDNQERLEFSIFQGEDVLVKNNILLGEFIVSGIPPGKAQEDTITVFMSIDKMGILNLSAVIKSTNNVQKATVQADTKRLTKEEKLELKDESESDNESEEDTLLEADVLLTTDDNLSHYLDMSDFSDSDEEFF